MDLKEKLEAVKSMLKSSPREEIQWYDQGKLLSMVVSKTGCGVKYKTQYMPGENCPEVAPTPKDSAMSFLDHGGTPQKNL